MINTDDHTVTAVESSEELQAAARHAVVDPDPTLVERIDRSLQAATDRGETGRLYVARALALQGQGDASGCAAAARRAIPHLLAADDTGAAAYASAMSAVFLDQIGQSAAAVEHIVDALVMLEDRPPTDVAAVRASLAISGFLARVSAFDLAIDAGRRAFDDALALDGVPIDTVAYSTGYIAAEGGHAASSEEMRERRLELADRTAAWLVEHGENDVAVELFGHALQVEVDLARGGDGQVDGVDLGAGERLYAAVPADLVAWHRVLRGSVARRRGDVVRAIQLFDEGLPGLYSSADRHCLVRGLAERAEARAATGDLDGAYRDACELAAVTRRWQLDHADQLAAQLSRRADLVRSNSRWQDTAARLAEDIEWDATTGVRSRRWFDEYVGELLDDDRVGSVVILDLDHFKSINDTYGHTVGDHVLQRVGSLLTEEAGDRHAVARFGGEEFVVVVHDVHPQAGYRLAERVRATVEATDWSDLANDMALTLSAGVAHGRLASVNDLFGRADDALLRAKRAGRNLVGDADQGVPSSTATG